MRPVHRTRLAILLAIALVAPAALGRQRGTQLVDAMVPTPTKPALQIELRGNLAAMVSATVQTKRSSESDDLSLQVSLVAGAGFEPATFGL